MKSISLRFMLVLFLLIGLASILPAQTVIKVAAGTDVISGALKTAAAGSIIELTSSGGVYAETGDIIVTKDITVRAAAGLAKRPVIYCGGSNTFSVNGGGLNVSGIKFDDPAQLLYFINIKSDTVNTSTNWNVRIDNCEFTNCGQRCVYTSDGTMRALDSLLITNSIFIDNVKMILYEKGIRNTPTNKTQPGGAKYIKMENCLIVGTSSTSDGWATYIEPANRDSASYKWPTVFINHLTVDSMALGGINTYTTPGAVVQNCIVINSKDTARYAFGAETGRFVGAPRSTIKNVVYNAFPNRFVTYGSSSTAGNAYPDTSKIIRATPVFVNAANRDYRLAAGSVGKNAGTDGLDIGYLPGGIATEVETFSDQVPASFQLSQNYPNPFNPTTTIQFSIAKAGSYSLQVYNILGQKVASLLDKEVAPGVYRVQFDASKLSSGMYLYTLTGANLNLTQKMMLLK